MIQMAETREWGLVKRYAHEGSQAAFRLLVDRYANLVYSTCLREVGDRQVAEDACQATFLVLATKANALRPSGPLSSWLFTTARLVSKNARRRHLARQRLEQAAMDDFVRQQQSGGGDHWSEVSENLHAAMDKLSPADREAILLRFFEQLSMRETADVLGVTEPAAKKRVGRALERLRTRLSGRQVVVPAMALGGLLTDRAVDAAPAHCLNALHAINYPTVLPLASGHTLPAHAHEYAKGALHSMKLGTHIKLAVVVASAVAVMSIGVGIYAFGRTVRVNGHLYASVPTPAGGWVLRHQFTNGKRVTYSIQQSTNAVTTLSSGQTIPSKIDSDLTLTESVKSVDPSTGIAVMHLQLSLDGIKSNGQPVTVPPQTVATITKPADIEVTPLGRMTPISSGGGTGTGVLDTLASTDSFPDQPIKPGDTWSAKFAMFGNNFDCKSTLENVADEGGRKVAMVEEVVTKSQAQPSAPPSPDIASMSFDTATIEEQFDVTTGCLITKTTKSISTFDSPAGQGKAHTVANTDQVFTLQSS